MLLLLGALKSVVYYLWVQLMPQQKGTVTRPQMTLAQPPVMTLQGSSHSRIIVGQLQTGVSSTYTLSLMFLMLCGVFVITWSVAVRIKQTGTGGV